VQLRQSPPDGARNAVESPRPGVGREILALGWSAIGVALTLFAAIAADSPALTGFGLALAIETIAAAAALRVLTGKRYEDPHRVRRLIGYASLGLVMIVLTQSMWVLTGTTRPKPSALGLGWLAANVVVMLLLARTKRVARQPLDNPISLAAAMIAQHNAVLAGAVLVGLAANAALGWWWADPAAAVAIVVYGLRQGLTALD